MYIRQLVKSRNRLSLIIYCTVHLFCNNFRFTFSSCQQTTRPRDRQKLLKANTTIFTTFFANVFLFSHVPFSLSRTVAYFAKVSKKGVEKIKNKLDSGWWGVMMRNFIEWPCACASLLESASEQKFFIPFYVNMASKSKKISCWKQVDIFLQEKSGTCHSYHIREERKAHISPCRKSWLSGHLTSFCCWWKWAVQRFFSLGECNTSVHNDC